MGHVSLEIVYILKQGLNKCSISVSSGRKVSTRHYLITSTNSKYTNFSTGICHHDLRAIFRTVALTQDFRNFSFVTKYNCQDIFTAAHTPLQFRS
jgi:hypothetical protein